MPYYHNLITEKSWQELMHLKRTLDFVLIGGWAVYLYTKALKSKDIDIIIDFDQLPILEKNYHLNKNQRLKKYQAQKQEIEIDIYLPHFSQIGIPVEELLKKTTSLESFKALDAGHLLALKIYTLSQRGRTIKGRKDFIDIISLILTGKKRIKDALIILRKFKIQKTVDLFLKLLNETTELPELELNAHRFARSKKEILVILNKTKP